jgi:hypothetical protein
MSTSERYRRFAQAEAHGESDRYEEWALGVAGDLQLLDLLDGLPSDKRQPNLLFAAARYVGVASNDFAEFRTALLARWPTVRRTMLEKRTQSNEPGRCAVLLPVLASLPQPLALLEVGASAGLCLYPDKFSYQYGDHPRLDPAAGPGAAVLHCEINGTVPLPTQLPEIAWRGGIDLNPLDVWNREDMRWLETLIWPEQQHRRERLTAAIDVARHEPARIVAGDLNQTIEQLAGEAPTDATLVIFHSAVLAYLDHQERTNFVTKMTTIDGHWISNESPAVVPMPRIVEMRPSPAPGRALFVVARDGQALAYSGPHGQSLHWIG